MIPRGKVQSAVIHTIGFLPIPYTDNPLQLGVLDVELMNGNLYRYYDVPRALFVMLTSGGSVGTVFNRDIKDKFPCAQLRKVERASRRAS